MCFFCDVSSENDTRRHTQVVGNAQTQKTNVALLKENSNPQTTSRDIRNTHRNRIILCNGVGHPRFGFGPVFLMLRVPPYFGSCTLDMAAKTACRPPSDPSDLIPHFLVVQIQHTQRHAHSSCGWHEQAPDALDCGQRVEARDAVLVTIGLLDVAL